MVVYYEPPAASGRLTLVPVVIGAASLELFGTAAAAAGPIGAGIAIGAALIYGLFELFRPRPPPPEPSPVPIASFGQVAMPPFNGLKPRNPGDPDPGIRPPVPPCTSCECPQVKAAAALAEAAGVWPTGAVRPAQPPNLADDERARCKSIFTQAYRAREPWLKESCLAYHSIDRESAGGKRVVTGHCSACACMHDDMRMPDCVVPAVSLYCRGYQRGQPVQRLLQQWLPALLLQSQELEVRRLGCNHAVLLPRCVVRCVCGWKGPGVLRLIILACCDIIILACCDILACCACTSCHHRHRLHVLWRDHQTRVGSLHAC